jgi:type II secretory pathway pseudopilin PulG
MKRRSLSLNRLSLNRVRNSERGYMLITLMLAFALIAIGLLAVLPEIGQQIRRDREEELRHRGTSYMRAIQHFYKKF